MISQQWILYPSRSSLSPLLWEPRVSLNDGEGLYNDVSSSEAIWGPETRRSHRPISLVSVCVWYLLITGWFSSDINKFGGRGPVAISRPIPFALLCKFRPLCDILLESGCYHRYFLDVSLLWMFLLPMTSYHILSSTWFFMALGLRLTSLLILILLWVIGCHLEGYWMDPWQFGPIPLEALMSLS